MSDTWEELFRDLLRQKGYDSQVAYDPKYGWTISYGSNVISGELECATTTEVQYRIRLLPEVHHE